jgi:hypothetical protein
MLTQQARKATDWDRYYASVPPTAALTRKYTTSVLVGAIRRFAASVTGGAISIVEIGGANSCFLDAILASIRPRTYDVIDTNAYGLSLLEKRGPADGVVRVHQESVLSLSYSQKADLVYSVGLVEHFEPADTRKAVLSHFDIVREGGTVIITFPTPTLLYRLTRSLIEMLGMWKFPDERPLRPEEVLATIRERGEIQFEKILWPLMLTQYFVVARKRQ